MLAVAVANATFNEQVGGFPADLVCCLHVAQLFSCDRDNLGDVDVQRHRHAIGVSGGKV